jgi:hypothetical protein
MSYYKHHRHIDALQYVVVDVPPCHTDDVHSEDSVRKKNLKIKIAKFHENLYVGILVTAYGKRNGSVCSFELSQTTHRIYLSKDNIE